MSYSLEFDAKSIKDLKTINIKTRDFILDSLEDFAKKFNNDFEKELLKTRKIKSLKGIYKSLYRLRLRTYRVIYQKEDDTLVIFVVKIAHRKEAY